jgi:hypothetical protein
MALLCRVGNVFLLPTIYLMCGIWWATVNRVAHPTCLGTLAGIQDPVQWQREQRQDRPLFGRDD